MRSIVSAAAAGAVAALAVGLLWRSADAPAVSGPAKAERAAVSTRAAPTPSDGADAADDVAALRRKVSALEARIDAIEARPHGPASAAARTLATRWAREAAPDPSAEGSAGRPALPADVEENVQTLVRAEIEAEHEARWADRQAAIQERARESVAAFAAANGLRPEQIERVSAALEAERSEMLEHFRAARETMDFESIRARAQEVRARTDATAEDALDSAQMSAWREMRDDERERWWGGRPRRGSDDNERRADE